MMKIYGKQIFIKALLLCMAVAWMVFSIPVYAEDTVYEPLP